MDTQTELPEHIKKGSFVKIAEWIGKISDIAYGETHTMILVVSPKQIYRHSHPEWLDLQDGKGAMIYPATKEDFLKECRRYADRAYQDYESLKTLEFSNDKE